MVSLYHQTKNWWFGGDFSGFHPRLKSLHPIEASKGSRMDTGSPRRLGKTNRSLCRNGLWQSFTWHRCRWKKGLACYKRKTGINFAIEHGEHGQQMEVSWNKGTPSHHPFYWDLPWNKPSNARLGYPHDYGNQLNGQWLNHTDEMTQWPSPLARRLGGKEISTSTSWFLKRLFRGGNYLV